MIFKSYITCPHCGNEAEVVVEGSFPSSAEAMLIESVTSESGHDYLPELSKEAYLTLIEKAEDHR